MLEVEKRIIRDEENAEKIRWNISQEKIDKNLKFKDIVNSEVKVKFVLFH